MITRTLLCSATLFASLGLATASFAQCAGCGADYNRTDRAATAREAEAQRVQRYDTPIRPDPVGNALIGGAVGGAMTGSAAGAAAAFRNGVVSGTAIEQVRKK